MPYVLPNGEGIVIETPDEYELSRLFASMWGAANHPDAPPTTPFEKEVEMVALYSTREVMDNEWKTTGLKPTRFALEYKIDKGPTGFPEWYKQMPYPVEESK